MIEDKAVVLFQGDSITDAGRNRQNPFDLGHGYPMLVASLISALKPERDISFINRGISGNTAKDLVNRWEEDCLAPNPTWVSIMIGINDCWRRFDRNQITSVDQFESSYRRILDQTTEHLDAKIILLEPFVLPVPDDRKDWRIDLDPKIQVVRQLAAEYQTLLVTLDSVFAKLCTYKPPQHWAEDGVHPTVAGHGVIASEWLKAVKML